MCRIADKRQAEGLIEDLRRAVRNSQRSGGEYQVFLPGSAGGGQAPVIAIQLDLPAALKRRARRRGDKP